MGKRQLQYNYAQLDKVTNKCIGVHTQTDKMPTQATNYIAIEFYSGSYMGKYYNYTTLSWYEDEGYTIPWAEHAEERGIF